MRIDHKNRGVYCDPAVVKHYAGCSALQPAERNIFDQIASELVDACLLDIGVGGGRTTIHLAPRVKRYIGLDYSAPMIAAASARFAARGYEFVVGDARALPLPDGELDVVVFSHNGIDYVDHEDRLVVLAEVRRTLRQGGLFVFSTHNLERDDLHFEAGPREGLFHRLVHARTRARLREHNPDREQLRSQPHAILNDGVFDFRAATYHIRRGAQLEQLASAGFERVQTFSGRTGEELSVDQGTPADPWLYFLCRRS